MGHELEPRILTTSLAEISTYAWAIQLRQLTDDLTTSAVMLTRVDRTVDGFIEAAMRYRRAA